MDINQLLNELKETYSFSNATYTQTPGETMTDFVFCLTQDQITRFIQKASQMCIRDRKIKAHTQNESPSGPLSLLL